jgi:hypothetical protein
MSLPSHTLEELKNLINNFEGGHVDRWYQAEDNPILYVGFGEYGERFHIAYESATEYLIEIGQVYGSGLGWNDFTERILTGEPREDGELDEY